MDRFLIITNKEKDTDLHVTKKIVAYIEQAGKQALLSRVSSVQEETGPVTVPKDMDCAIVLGGDGTIIQTANDLMTHNIPILGVNMGTLGFLAEIEEHHVPEALERLFQDDYHIENRIMIEANVIHDSKHVSIPEQTMGYALDRKSVV